MSRQTTCVVVDDDYNTTEIFAEFLELKGLKVLGCGYNGKDAVKLYRQNKPDVVFLDVMMPQYDGLYGLEEIRKECPDAHVIMVTADLRAQTEDRLRQLSATAIVFKPFEIDRIMEIVARLSLQLDDAKDRVSEVIHVN